VAWERFDVQVRDVNLDLQVLKTNKGTVFPVPRRVSGIYVGPVAVSALDQKRSRSKIDFGGNVSEGELVDRTEDIAAGMFTKTSPGGSRLSG